MVKNTEAETAAGIIPGTDTGEGTLTYDTYSGSIYGNVLNIFAVWAEDVNKNDTPDYEETTWFVKYNLNGGTYTDGEIPLDKGTDDKGYLAKTTAELKYSTEEEKKKLTHDDSDSHKVVFVGWTTSENPAIIDKEGTTVPELIEDKITMPDEPPKNDDETTRSHNVYAVWAVDENSNGEADYLESKVKLTYNYNNGTKAGDGSYSGDIERVAYYDKKRGEITPNPNYHPEPRGGKQEVFIGWSKERKADAVSSKPTDLLEKIDIQEENVTVYAVYAVDEKGDPTNRDGKGNGNPDYDDHKVTFDDGDSGTSLSPMPSDIPFAAPGEVITIEDKTPEREGYSFKGWKDPTNESGALLLPGGTFVMPDEDVTVTAQWEEKKGTVVYDNNHTALGLTADLGITGTLPTDSKKYAPGETVTIEAIAGDGKLTYTKPADSETAVEGAVFLGWSHDQRTLLTSAPAEGSVLTAGKTTPFAVNTGTDTMTLYAVWALDADNNDQADYIDGLCTIVYDDGVEGDPSGVTNLPPTVSVNPAENYTISNIEPSRTGYRFTGWKIDGDETNYRYTGGTSVVPAGKLNKGETVTLVAQWAAAYGVVYRANYGTGTVPEHSDSYAKDGEGTVTLDDPTGLSRDGYTFLGWTAHYAADPVTTKEAETKLLEGKGTGPNDIKMYKVGDSETKPTFTLSPDNDTYMIFYAVWAVDVNKNGKPDYSEDPWTLVYDAGEDHTINGETDGTPQTKEVKDQSYISGATVYLVRSVKPVKTPGMTFIGWSEKKPEAVYTTEPDASVLTETVTFGDDSDEAGTKTVYAVYAQDK